MIDLRILRRGTEGTLQYRTLGTVIWNDGVRNQYWTEWQDVPVVTEEEGKLSDMETVARA